MYSSLCGASLSRLENSTKFPNGFPYSSSHGFNFDLTSASLLVGSLISIKGSFKAISANLDSIDLTHLVGLKQLIIQLRFLSSLSWIEGMLEEVFVLIGHVVHPRKEWRGSTSYSLSSKNFTISLLRSFGFNS